MGIGSAGLWAAEHMDLPDFLLRAAVARRVAVLADRLAAQPADDAGFAAAMAARPVAVHTDAANAQHYEVPAAAFAATLGPNMKYSCCLYPQGGETLAAAELAALESSVAFAQLADGQEILELGCGWGSLTVHMARKFPNARITAVSNSASQRAFIEGRLRAEGLSNAQIITADMAGFAAPGRYDRIVSIEMFEHMANWRELLARLRGWLQPDGSVFVHVFTHARCAYRFEHGGDDFIANHFFTGGIMPSHGLMSQFADIMRIDAERRWSGHHYARTARQWLENFDANAARIAPVLASTYGRDAAIWRRRWRLFYLAVEGLFGHDGGAVWGVSQYRLSPLR